MFMTVQLNKHWLSLTCLTGFLEEILSSPIKRTSQHGYKAALE